MYQDRFLDEEPILILSGSVRKLGTDPDTLFTVQNTILLRNNELYSWNAKLADITYFNCSLSLHTLNGCNGEITMEALLLRVKSDHNRESEARSIIKQSIIIIN